MRTALRLLPPVVAAAIALAGCSGGGNDKAAAGDDKAAGAAQAPASQAPAAQGGGQSAPDDATSTAEPELEGATADQAKKAAMAAFPGGEFVRAERETPGKPGIYGVKIRKSDGTIMEVYLDKSFKVVGSVKKDKD